MIVFERVGKTYRSATGRSVTAVTDVSFSINNGEVVGIAGPNGAGKSTLIALMLGLLEPTSGRVSVDGRPPRQYAEHEGVGYLPELIPVNPVWRADETLTRLAVLAGVPARGVREKVDEVIDRVGLTEHRRKRCKQLSKGNLQKVGLAQTLLREERVYVFDEPTHGLDPVWTQRFREIMQQLRSPDRAMLIASHNLDELERVSDRVVIIDGGRIQRIVDLRNSVPVERMAYRLRVAAGSQALLSAFAGAVEVTAGEFIVPPIDLASLNRAIVEAINAGAIVSAVQPEKSALEREFNAAMRPGGPS